MQRIVIPPELLPKYYTPEFNRLLDEINKRAAMRRLEMMRAGSEISQRGAVQHEADR